MFVAQKFWMKRILISCDWIKQLMFEMGTKEDFLPISWIPNIAIYLSSKMSVAECIFHALNF